MPNSETAAQVAANVSSRPLPTLLIVGDPGGLNIARDALIELELGWEVLFAGSAFEALDIPAFREVDVILVDLGNPHIEAVELVEGIHGQFPQTPIVLMSAPFAVNVALECIRKGAVNHFPRELLDTEPAAVLDTLRAAALDHQRRRAVLARLDNVYFEFTLTNDRAQVPAIAGRLSDAAVETGLCDRTAGTRVGVALEECLLNAIVHGNLEISGELRQIDESAYLREIDARRMAAPYCTRRVKVTARISRQEGVFVIQDDGPGFDVTRVPDPTDPANLLRLGGRGILLMRSFMTNVHFADRGRRVTLVKRRG
jgi:CheY-like chemotaxis protein/anti-sigma regulatory factor (Ser/Thr protein kinase)